MYLMVLEPDTLRQVYKINPDTVCAFVPEVALELVNPVADGVARIILVSLSGVDETRRVSLVEQQRVSMQFTRTFDLNDDLVDETGFCSLACCWGVTASDLVAAIELQVSKLYS